MKITGIQIGEEFFDTAALGSKKLETRLKGVLDKIILDSPEDYDIARKAINIITTPNKKNLTFAEQVMTACLEFKSNIKIIIEGAGITLDKNQIGKISTDFLMLMIDISSKTNDLEEQIGEVLEQIYYNECATNIGLYLELLSELDYTNIDYDLLKCVYTVLSDTNYSDLIVDFLKTKQISVLKSSPTTGITMIFLRIRGNIFYIYSMQELFSLKKINSNTMEKGVEYFCGLSFGETNAVFKIQKDIISWEYHIGVPIKIIDDEFVLIKNSSGRIDLYNISKNLFHELSAYDYEEIGDIGLRFFLDDIGLKYIDYDGERFYQVKEKKGGSNMAAIRTATDLETEDFEDAGKKFRLN